MQYLLSERPGQFKYLVLCLIVVLWLVATAGVRPLILPDEGRYIGVAWEMLNGGQWWLPTMDGLPYFHKPPLFYWLTMASFKTCGTGLLCSRAAPLLGAVAMLFSLTWFLRRHLGKPFAWCALIILVTQPYFYAGAQFANHDMLVAGMVSVCIVMLADAVLSLQANLPYRPSLALAYVFAALGVLAKGLIGVVLPAMIVTIWLLSNRRWSLLLKLLWLPGCVLFLLVAAPWFLAMQMQYSGFFDYFFIHHHFQRFTGSTFNNQQPLWFYPLVLIALTLPWSWRLTALFSQSGVEHTAASRDIMQLMLIWVLAILIFFSIPVSKPLGYLLPVLPAFATLLTMLFNARPAMRTFMPAKYFSYFAVFAMLACLAGVAYEYQHSRHKAIHAVAQQLMQDIRVNDQLVFIGKYHFDLAFALKLTHPAWMVEAWNTPEVRLHDDWRKELVEAGQFAPGQARHVLIRPEALDSHFCQAAAGTRFWVIASGGHENQSQILTGRAPAFVLNGIRIWKIEIQKPGGLCASAV